MSAISGSQSAGAGYIQSVRNKALAEKAALEEAKKKKAAEEETKTDTDETAESKETATTEDAQKLADFKKEFAKTVKSLTGQPHLAMSSVSVNITDEAYTKMMNDPAYKNKVVDCLKSTLNSSYSHPPSKAVFTIDKNGENVDTSFGPLAGMDRGKNILATMSTPNLRMGMTYYKNQNMSDILGILGNSGIDSYSNSALGGLNSLSAFDWLG